MYEFIAASFFYWIIAASIAELSSAIPSSGGGSSFLQSDGRRIDADVRKQCITGQPSQLVDMGDHVGGLLAGGIAWRGYLGSPLLPRSLPLKQCQCTLFSIQHS